jgi:hypothetical protein
MDSLLSWGSGSKRRSNRTPRLYPSSDKTSKDVRTRSETTAACTRVAEPELGTSDDDSDASMHARRVEPTFRPAKRLKPTVAPSKRKPSARGLAEVHAATRNTSAATAEATAHAAM